MIKIRTLKRVKKNFDEVFTKYKSTQEVEIAVQGKTIPASISITCQQFRHTLSTPYVTIITGDRSYNMDWTTFIKSITK